MKDAASRFDADLSDLGHDEWLTQLEEVATEFGSFERLGAHHLAAFIDEGPELLVTFESVDVAREQNHDEEPIGFAFVRSEGWSHLAILATKDTWFRDETVYGYFDRLVDDGFFEDFDSVLFYGAGMSGYAAAAFAVAAPGTRVLALRPQATLDPRVTGWANRFTAMRRTSFTDRYGYAPDMIDALDRAYIVYDPFEPMDAMHGALFTKPNATKLRVPHLGGVIERDMAGMHMLAPMITSAMDGTLTGAAFSRLYRKRQSHLPYLRGLLAVTEKRDRPDLARRVCNFVLRDRQRPFFARKLELLNGANPE